MTYTPSANKPRAHFVYDANDRLMARTSDGRTKLFFYFGDTGRVAEETSATGSTKTLYCSDTAGRSLAEVKDDNWTWLLRDAEGSVATRLSDNGTVKSHSAYDPYGASNDAGSGIAVGERDPETELGYQSESADTVTGNILVGPRQFDPTTQRFTTADVFIDAGSDLSLATDPLTGNRYLFAAANPVALDDDGHGPCVSDCNRMYSGTKEQQRERERGADSGRHETPEPSPDRGGGARTETPGSLSDLWAGTTDWASPPGSDPPGELLRLCAESGHPWAKGCNIGKWLWTGTKAGPAMNEFFSQPIDACDYSPPGGETIMSFPFGPMCIPDHQQFPNS